MTIREYAKKVNFEVVGKLTRRADWEETKTERWYIDEARNEYLISNNKVAICTSEGAII